MTFIVDLNLDGYDTEKEHDEACMEFIREQLNHAGSCVGISEFKPRPEVPITQSYNIDVVKVRKLEARHDKLRGDFSQLHEENSTLRKLLSEAAEALDASYNGLWAAHDFLGDCHEDEKVPTKDEVFQTGVAMDEAHKALTKLTAALGDDK